MSKKEYFDNLDGLRFFSFLIVFLSHSFNTDSAEVKATWMYQKIKVTMFADGDLGVSFFFVLSGFLITYLLIKEKQKQGQINLLFFYARRSLRIWPLYYFCVAFGFIAFPWLKIIFGETPNETANPILCSFFLNNFDKIAHGTPDSSVLSVLWSVAIEEQFYLVWPLFFLFVPKTKYWLIFLFVILSSLLFRFVHTANVEIHTLGVMSDLAIGGFGAYLINTFSVFSTRIKELSKTIEIIPYIFFIVILIFKVELFASYTMFMFKRLICATVFLWIILDQGFCQNSPIPFGRFKWLTWLGKHTYGLYCLHTIGILVSITVVAKFGLNKNFWNLLFIELPLSLILSIALSAFSYRYFESVFLKIKDKFFTLYS
jgi:peptidoglycan/LPS O-acetylase OafA/YrhL